jgi:hypothetical protein
MYDYVEAASLAFWDMYLKDSRSAERYLHGRDIPASSGGQVHLSEK